MPEAPKARRADVIGATVMIGKIATGGQCLSLRQR
jgi:hypothetical protein